MNNYSEHAENIADDMFQDAYGGSGRFSREDVWLLLDSIHSNLCEEFFEEEIDYDLLSLLSKFMREVGSMENK